MRRRVRARAAQGTIQDAVTGVVIPPSVTVMPSGLRTLREGDQGYPTKTDLPSMHDKAAQDLHERKLVGIQRYGSALQPGNGRDAARDAYEEALDGAAYMASVVWEQDHPEETYVGCLIESLKTGQPLNFRGRFVPPAVQELLDSWDKR